MPRKPRRAAPPSKPAPASHVTELECFRLREASLKLQLARERRGTAERAARDALAAEQAAVDQQNALHAEIASRYGLDLAAGARVDFASGKITRAAGGKAAGAPAPGSSKEG